MKNNGFHSHHIEINDLIDDAINNALTRRELVAVCDDEAASVAGGLKIPEPAIAGMRPIEPYCPPIKPIKPIEPICYPTKPPIKPICPPIVVGLIYVPEKELPIA